MQAHGVVTASKLSPAIEQQHVKGVGRPSAATLNWTSIADWWPLILESVQEVRRRDRVRVARRDEVVELLSLLMVDRFSRVRLFHGCRPTDPAIYQREGVRRHGPDVLHRARQAFQAQGIPTGDIEAAIAEADWGLDEGRIFFALDGDHLVDHAGHYMIYGSEAAMVVGAGLIRRGYRSAQDRLRASGQPTLLVCDVPLSLLSDYQLYQIAESLYDEYRLNRGRRPRQPSSRDHTVVVRADVPPSAVKGYITPSRIPDWHRGGLPYMWPEPTPHAG